MFRRGKTALELKVERETAAKNEIFTEDAPAPAASSGKRSSVFDEDDNSPVSRPKTTTAAELNVENKEQDKATLGAALKNLRSRGLAAAPVVAAAAPSRNAKKRGEAAGPAAVAGDGPASSSSASAAPKTKKKRGKVTWDDEENEIVEKALPTPKRQLTPGDKRRTAAREKAELQKFTGPSPKGRRKNSKEEADEAGDDADDDVLQGRSRQLLSKNVTFRSPEILDLSGRNSGSGSKSKGSKSKSPAAAADDDEDDHPLIGSAKRRKIAAPEQSTPLPRSSGKKAAPGSASARRLGMDQTPLDSGRRGRSAGAIDPVNKSPYQNNWRPGQIGDTRKSLGLFVEDDHDQKKRAGASAATSSSSNSSSSSASATMTAEELRHAAAVAALKAKHQGIGRSPFLKQRKSDDEVTKKNTELNRKYLMPLLNDEQSALLALFKSIDQVLAMYRQLRARRTCVGDIRKDVENGSNRQLTTSRLQRILFVAGDLLKAERMASGLWNPTEEHQVERVKMDHGDEDITLDQIDEAGKFCRNVDPNYLLQRWRRVAERLGSYGLRPIPHQELPGASSRDDGSAPPENGIANKTPQNGKKANITPQPKSGAGKMRVSSASGKKLSISEKAKHKGKIATKLKKLTAERDGLEKEVDKISRLLTLMPLIEICFDQKGRPQFVNYDELLREVCRINKEGLNAKAIAEVLAEFAQEVPEWLSVRVSKYDEEVKTVHLKPDFNRLSWRKETTALREVKKNRLAAIDVEKNDLYVVE
eukprot:g478.t1